MSGNGPAMKAPTTGPVGPVRGSGRRPLFLVPPKCLLCGAPWVGGHARPGDEMADGLRVRYDCGASLMVSSGGAFPKNWTEI